MHAKRIVTIFTEQLVVVASADENIVTATAEDQIDIRATDDHVVAIATVDNRICRNRRPKPSRLTESLPAPASMTFFSPVSTRSRSILSLPSNVLMFSWSMPAPKVTVHTQRHRVRIGRYDVRTTVPLISTRSKPPAPWIDRECIKRLEDNSGLAVEANVPLPALVGLTTVASSAAVPLMVMLSSMAEHLHH